MGMRISKSKFCAGVQCLKRLYLQVHQPELAAEPDAASEAIIQQGREVGMLARTLFPGGVEVCCEHDLDQAIRATRDHEHDGCFHQFGSPRADAWGNPHRADSSE